MMDKVGILAFGSLIADPGSELSPFITERISCKTPFKVEFARTSSTRDGAPTLVPFDAGDFVDAIVLVVDLPLTEAINRLYRRELHEVGSKKTYTAPALNNRNSVRVEQLEDFAGVSLVLYTRIGANIQKPTAIELSRLAIKSARARTDGKDGITYLLNAVASHIHTPLSEAYTRKILDLTGAEDLSGALKVVQATAPLKAGEPPGMHSVESKLRLAEDYLFAGAVLATQPGPEADIRLLLPGGQMVAHAAEMLLKAMLDLKGLHVPRTHDLVELRHLLVSEGC